MHLRHCFKHPVPVVLDSVQTSLSPIPSTSTLGYGALVIIPRGDTRPLGPKLSEKEVMPKAGREVDALQEGFRSKNQD